LGKIGDHASTPRVASYLGNPSPLLRGEAAVALWRLADSTALEGLLERHNDLNAEVRWRVLYALEKIVAPDRVVPAVTPHLDDSEWLVRAYAARTLGRQKSARATASLISALADHEPAVVVNALRSLQQIADSTCVPCARVLTRLLDQPHPYVRVTAATALAERFALAKADSVARRAALDSLGAHLEDPDAATRGADARISIRDALRSPAGRTFADSGGRLHPARNAAPEDYPPHCQLAPAVRGAVLETTAGRIEWAFYGREAPGTVRNFVRLAERGYFDGLSIHRVVPNFVIQDGDPTGTVSGGPGDTIRVEDNRQRF